MGGKPSKGTSKDMRLKENKPKLLDTRFNPRVPNKPPKAPKR